MQKYNTTLKKIQLPEYGRNIETLINYCKTIPDRRRRTRYARGIVQFMALLKNDNNPSESQKRVYWDHLALLSNFELDIDYPYPIIKQDNINSQPEPVDYQLGRIRYRQYGIVVENMIRQALTIEDEGQRIRLLELCANHMKLQFHLANKDIDEDDDKIIHDLIDYVGQEYAEECFKVFLYPIEELKVNEQYNSASIDPAPKKKKKKKKKKSKNNNANK